ncbi:hypothetical protein LS684_20390 [Cytobacillus spongiae]|uniref:2TM domain-containing protein n=1 Tax=Cytobacillus spongiae TaxID=2901381 RepID=UPI001F23BC96|nr:2TM domain-containing protein [Cytobacillus spongiae]UII55942.1 hypothetical protein LS684_20390 [Cytobacillus spongiae]
MGWLIIACEIGFWIFVIAGLFTRYVLKRKKAGAILLLCTPIIDLILIIATVYDLKSGQSATFIHGLAAYYIGMTIAFGQQMVQWADVRFAYFFSNGPKPQKKAKFGREHARLERRGWYQHLLGWVVGNLLLFSMMLFVGDPERTEELFKVFTIWGLVLAVDFVISFSYTIFPRKRTSITNEW